MTVRLQEDRRTGKKTKVAWVEETSEGRSSRTKQLDSEEQARLYKRLVEENGNKMPPYVVLKAHGLTEFGYPISPDFVLALRAIVFRDEMSAEEKIKLLTRALEDF